MPKQIPVGFADIAVHWRRLNDLEDMIVTFGVSWSAPNHDAIASDVALAVAFAWPNSSLPTQVTGTKVVARVAEEGDVPSVQEASLNLTGTAAGASLLPSNCAMLVTKHTSHGGRQGTGRMFWPWILEGEVDDNGIINSSPKTTYQGRFDNLLSGLSDTSHGNSTPMVVLHGPNRLGVLPVPYPVTGLELEAQIGTQRQRMRR